MWVSRSTATAAFSTTFPTESEHCKPPAETAPKTVFRASVNTEPKDKATNPAVVPDKQHNSNLASHQKLFI